MNINTGVVYLTIGTIQEVQWLTKHLDLELEYLYEPTTVEFLTCIESTSFFETKPRLVIVIPKKLKGTPRRLSKGASLSGYELPNDELIRVDPQSYFFVITSPEEKDAAKKIQGGIYEILNLQNIPYGVSAPQGLLDYHKGYPYVIERKCKSNNLLVEVDIVNKETKLIQSLTTVEGVIKWGNFTKGELFSYFLTPEVDKILILMHSKAWCLEPYLKSVLSYVEEQIESDNPSAYLQKFAFWIYCSTKYWNDYNYPGLSSYKSRNLKYEGNVIFTFKPSQRARLEYNKIMGLTQ